MKCLETERLMHYAYHLMDETAASQVRAHLGECVRCREIVKQHGRLDTLLDEWKVAEPSPWFDVRVRSAVEAQQANRQATGFWGLTWVRDLALASLAVLLVAGAFWFTRSHIPVPSRVAVRQPHPVMVPPAAPQTAQTRPPLAKPPAGVKPAPSAPVLKPTFNFSNEDKDTLALEDYDLAANFDLLSELPKGEPRVAN